MHPRFHGLQDTLPFGESRHDPGDEQHPAPHTEARHGVLTDRLTHAVLVDGRLVDLWSEPVEGTRWAGVARSLDREQHPEPPPEPPLHEQVLTWLTAVCGGPGGLAGLDDVPLPDQRPALPPTDSLHERQHLEVASEQLDRVADEFFDHESGVALRRALVRFWVSDPRVRLRSPAHLAAGVTWSVGRANERLGSRSRCSHQALSHQLGISPSAVSCAGQSVQRTLNGVMPSVPRPRQVSESPQVELMGHLDLLLASTRHRLLLLRDQALRARAGDGSAST